ncbi:hypothetical protein G9P44_001339 [Scheffersomyces stipitis]|nr:hypothetical protein G9P44_001339 [Scheffersomyces stipitis]
MAMEDGEADMENSLTELRMRMGLPMNWESFPLRGEAPIIAIERATIGGTGCNKSRSRKQPEGPR